MATTNSVPHRQAEAPVNMILYADAMRGSAKASSVNRTMLAVMGTLASSMLIVTLYIQMLLLGSLGVRFTRLAAGTFPREPDYPHFVRGLLLCIVGVPASAFIYFSPRWAVRAGVAAAATHIAVLASFGWDKNVLYAWCSRLPPTDLGHVNSAIWGFLDHFEQMALVWSAMLWLCLLAALVWCSRYQLLRAAKIEVGERQSALGGDAKARIPLALLVMAVICLPMGSLLWCYTLSCPMQLPDGLHRLLPLYDSFSRYDNSALVAFLTGVVSVMLVCLSRSLAVVGVALSLAYHLFTLATRTRWEWQSELMDNRGNRLAALHEWAWYYFGNAHTTVWFWTVSLLCCLLVCTLWHSRRGPCCSRAGSR